MKIAFVIQDMFRQGAEYATAMVASGLVENGHEVHVVVSARHVRNPLDDKEVRPFDLDGRVVLHCLKGSRASENLFPMVSFIRDIDPDAIIVMTSTYMPVVVAARYLSRRSPAVLMVDHSCGKSMNVPGQEIHNVRPKIGHLLSAWVCTWAQRRLDGIMAVSSGARDNILKKTGLPSDYVSVVYNPVINASFKERASRRPSHAFLVDKNVPVIVAAGALSAPKGFSVLVDAFRIVKAQMDCRLVIFGEGPLRAQLSQHIEKNGVIDCVALAGFTDNLPANIRAADLFVVSSYYESFSIVLVEALACGTPVVSTNCPVGPPEILGGGKFGVLVEVGNPEALAAGILSVLAGSRERIPDEAWAPYCVDKIVFLYERTICEAVKRRSKKRMSCEDSCIH